MSGRTINTIIEEFFDYNLPCPAEIPMCKEVREAYQRDIDKASSEGCTQCRKNTIKAKYLEAIWKEAVQSLISKGS